MVARKRSSPLREPSPLSWPRPELCFFSFFILQSSSPPALSVSLFTCLLCSPPLSLSFYLNLSVSLSFPSLFPLSPSLSLSLSLLISFSLSLPPLSLSLSVSEEMNQQNNMAPVRTVSIAARAEGAHPWGPRGAVSPRGPGRRH